MQTSGKAAQMTLPGGKHGRSFHPSIVEHSKDADLQRSTHVPDWSDKSSVSADETLTCYESMVSLRHGYEYYQDLEDARYFRRIVNTRKNDTHSRGLIVCLCTFAGT